MLSPGTAGIEETSPLFSDAERAALRLGYHAALVPNEATAADFDELKRHFDEGQIVEIVATIATMIAGTAAAA